MLGLLLVAAAMFAGCKNAPAETSSKKDGLFAAGDTPVTMTGTEFYSIDLPDGTWSYKKLYESSGGSCMITEFTFTKSGTTFNITKGSEYYEGKSGSGESKAWTQEKLTQETNSMNGRNYHLYLSDFMVSEGTLKKNAENTKFYSNYTTGGTVNGQPATYKVTVWLKKN